jgi:hypothetical protein
MDITKNSTKYLLHHFLIIGVMILPLDSAIKMLIVLASFFAVYGQLSIEEVYLFVCINIFFTFMNYMSIVNGIFSFTTPDLIHLPWYEFVMWGVYVLHLKRMVDFNFKKEFEKYKINLFDYICVGLVVIIFSVCKEKNLVTILPLLVNFFYLIMKRSKMLTVSYLYFIVIGGVLEVVGTNGGQWSYPQPDFYGVPFWYVNVFGSFAIYFPLVFKSMVYVLHTNFMKKIQGNLVQKISYLDESESSKISR